MFVPIQANVYINTMCLCEYKRVRVCLNKHNNSWIRLDFNNDKQLHLCICFCFKITFHCGCLEDAHIV
eukprot:TRINITY_DN1227_c0_g1_i1.p2 TRINITY_DN1227_c0_g1~~TRINITY_DN1227_c0_g1_i1.p2  ORF type:complete len:68 (-),score=8.90 TRINITY_DN1227_c0_g1_i1:332-535(-)